MSRFSFLFLVLPVMSCVPYYNPALGDIASIRTLKEVMDAQATIADPEWSKIGDEAYSDDDYARFRDVAARIAATAKRSKAFSKGPAFDQYADRLASAAQKLGKAAEQKDRDLSSVALEEMRGNCKACHAELR